MPPEPGILAHPTQQPVPCTANSVDLQPVQVAQICSTDEQTTQESRLEIEEVKAERAHLESKQLTLKEEIRGAEDRYLKLKVNLWKICGCLGRRGVFVYAVKCTGAWSCKNDALFEAQCLSFSLSLLQPLLPQRLLL